MSYEDNFPTLLDILHLLDTREKIIHWNNTLANRLQECLWFH